MNIAQLTVYWSDYPKLGLLSGSVMALLCLTLLFVPGLIHWLFQIDSTTGADVMSGRAAMLFAGLAFIAFQARNADPSPLRATISLGIAITMGGLACVGLFDFLRGAVGYGIWLAILVEVFFVTAYLRFWRAS